MRRYQWENSCQSFSRARRSLLLSASIAISLAPVSLAKAATNKPEAPQPSVSVAEINEIVVTARKRAEAAISAPVTLTVVTQSDLELRGVRNLDDVSRIVPQLRIAAAGQGTNAIVALRGIGTGPGNIFGDTSVAFNIDGVGLAKSPVRRLATFDIAQVEVLKGPQALFFGKNSPGGVISMRTADPTAEFEAKASVGYEFEGRQTQAEGYISGPITPTLGFRLAGIGSHTGGWLENTAPEPYNTDRRPSDEEYGERLTLTFNPLTKFSARFKASYNHLKKVGYTGNTQYVFCPLGGQTKLGVVVECRPDSKFFKPGWGETFAPPLYDPALLPGEEPLLSGGRPGLKQRQALTSLEMNYDVTDSIRLTSISGYYDLLVDPQDDYTLSAIPSLLLPARNKLWVKQYTQELRLVSEFDGPLNFAIGGEYEELRGKLRSQTALNGVNPVALENKFGHNNGESYSIFAQGMVNILPDLELSGGARYSRERRTRDSEFPPITFDIPSAKFNNVSPEATLTWRPSSHLTVYGGYKTGFLSGGFASLNALPYEQITVRGFEGGVKWMAPDESLRLNFGVYSHTLKGLQTSRYDGVTLIVVNAGRSRIEGFEMDGSWKTPIDGWSFDGSLSYNQAKYLDFTIGCYPGQSIEMGCNLAPNSAGVFQLQSMNGRQLYEAPKFNGAIGSNFDTPLTSNINLGLFGNATYTSRYYADVLGHPGSYQSSYWIVDATVRLYPVDESWEVALIGRNLTNEYYIDGASSHPFEGGGFGRPGPTLPSDMLALVSRGRELTLRLTKRF